MVQNSKWALSFRKFMEIAGATSVVYGGMKKSPDFQWEGDPKSMIKPKKPKEKK